jgi:thiamine kinase-like enzyme
MLTPDTAPRYLLQRGLIDTRAIVEGDLLVIDSSRRNANFKVISERGPSYLLKQGIGPRRSEGIANEAAIYNYLHHEHPSHHTLRSYLAVLRFHDSGEGILVTDLLPNAAHLAAHHARTGRFSIRIASQLGKALALLHTPDTIRNPQRREGTRIHNLHLPAPWVLSAHHATIDLYRQLSNANLQLVRLLQHSPSAATLDDLRRSWRHSALIHYDLKMENIVVAGRRPILVDWELAGLGDPLWDAGSVLGEYLAAWLLSIPVTGDHPPDRFLELARYPLSSIQPAMRAFWHSYTHSSHRNPQSAIRNPQSAASYAAARLIQTAFERSQTSSLLTGEALCLLQVASNILARPREAAIHLLGIPPAASWRTSPHDK